MSSRDEVCLLSRCLENNPGCGQGMDFGKLCRSASVCQKPDLVEEPQENNGTMNPIYITQPFLPPLDEFNIYLKDIWNSKLLTNQAKFHKRFEEELARYLEVKHVSLFANGTLALMTAL